MEDSQSAAALVQSTTSKIQQLQKAFAELESHRAVTLNLKWKQLEEHFQGLEKSLKRRFTELEDQEKVFETKIVRSQEMLEKREAAVIAKEQASLVRLQKKRDAAVSAISIALEKHRKPFALDHATIGGEDLVADGRPPDAMVAESNAEDNSKATKTENVCPELVKLCQDMDSEGIHKFISDNRKNLAAIRDEIPTALGASNDPASLVLDSLRGFYSSEKPVSDAKKNSNLIGLRRTCIMLMECLSILLVNLEMDNLPRIISEDVKDRAKAIAEEWKPKLDDLDADASNGNSLEAHAFLQLLSTFGISSDFGQEDLLKLVPMVSRRRQAADLCRSLGLSDQMLGVIGVLVNNGRQIDAVNLAFAFELTEQFSPVSLLKSYLNEATSPVKPGYTSSSAVLVSPSPFLNDVIDKEMAALKAVMKSIEDHKLEQEYPLDHLQKRILLLEKVKADKKRATEVTKPQTKRPRAANGAAGYAPRINSEKSFCPGVNDRYPQGVYDRPYAYSGPALQGTVAYNLAPNHGGFFGNGYPYQVAYMY